jgi:hypothetical protein
MDTTVAHYAVSCSTDDYRPMPVTTTTLAPASVRAGSKFTIKWRSEILLTPPYSSSAYAVAPSGSVRGMIIRNTWLSSDATLPGKNVAAPPVEEFGTISNPNSLPVDTPPRVATTQRRSSSPARRAPTSSSRSTSVAHVTVYKKSGKKAAGPVTLECTIVRAPKSMATITVT